MSERRSHHGVLCLDQFTQFRRDEHEIRLRAAAVLEASFAERLARWQRRAHDHRRIRGLLPSVQAVRSRVRAEHQASGLLFETVPGFHGLVNRTSDPVIGGWAVGSIPARPGPTALGAGQGGWPLAESCPWAQTPEEASGK